MKSFSHLAPTGKPALRFIIVLLIQICAFAGPTTLQVVKSFERTPAHPSGGLFLANDGDLYGVTDEGGAFGSGVVYKLTPAGVRTTIHHFAPSTASTGLLAQGTDGALYGVTTNGGTDGKGSVYRLTLGGVFTTLHSFTGANGQNPAAGLIAASDSALYGTTRLGGTNSLGTIFKITTSGEFTKLYDFTFSDGAEPRAELREGSNGKLYGTASKGGNNNLGTVFETTKAGTLSRLFEFAGTNGRTPEAGVIEGSPGIFFGSTTLGGTNGGGSIFTFQPGVSFTPNIHSVSGKIPGGVTLHSDGKLYFVRLSSANDSLITIHRITTAGVGDGVFPDSNSSGSLPVGSLLEGDGGILLGAASRERNPLNGGNEGSGTVFSMTTAGVFDVVNRMGSDATGSEPSGDFLIAPDGNFYGLMGKGGAFGYGGVVKITLAGDATMLHSFAPSEGSIPGEGLCLANDGKLYGVLRAGGTNFPPRGCIFSVELNGTFAILASFDGTNGDEPSTALVQGSDNGLYGMTNQGGANFTGVIFRVTLSGTISVLRDLSQFTDGFGPSNTLVDGGDGFFYGVLTGGANGGGNVFKTTPAGSFSVLPSVKSVALSPSSLMRGSDGAFYGVSQGVTGNHGTVFRLSADGSTTTVLHNFPTTGAQGSFPQAELAETADGFFYGTTISSGPDNLGTVFRIKADGTFQLLHNFTTATGGAPFGKILPLNGSLYGFTPSSGPLGGGTLYRIDILPLPTAVTSAATDVSLMTATLNGSVNANGSATTVTFDFGTDTNYGQSLESTPLIVTGTSATIVSAPVGFGLQPETTYHFRVRAVSDAGTSLGADQSFTTPANRPPGGGTFSITPTTGLVQGMRVTANFAGWSDPDSLDPVFYEIRINGGFVDGTNDESLEFALPDEGTYEIQGAVVDVFGGEAVRNITVTVAPRAPQIRTLAATNTAVPGAGTDPRIVAGAKFTRFGPPAIDDSRNAAYFAKWTNGSGIFLNDQLAVASGENVPGLSGVRFASFGTPILDENNGGAIALIATLAGLGVSKANNQAVVYKQPGQSASIFIRTGEVLAEGTLASVQSIMLTQGNIIARAKLKAGTGNPKVTAATDEIALRRNEPSAATSTLFCREGQALEGSKLKSFTFLNPVKGSPGVSRHNITPNRTTTFVLLADGRRGYAEFQNNGSSDVFVANIPGTITFPDLTNPVIKALGAPLGVSQFVVTFVAEFVPNGGDVTKDNASGIMLRNPFTREAIFGTRASQAAPGFPADALFKKFTDPVSVGGSFTTTYFFVASTRGGGVKSSNDEGVWRGQDVGIPTLLAREGAPVPDLPATVKWKKFRAIAAGSDIIIQADVMGKGIKPATASGLWAEDSTGALRLIVRQGSQIGGRTVKTFTALTAFPGVTGASRAFNSRNDTAFHVIFTDGTQAIVFAETL